MKTLVLVVALAAVACGKSGMPADGAGGATGGAGAGATGGKGIGGTAGFAASTGGAVAGNSGAGDGAAGRAGGTAGAAGSTTGDGGVDVALGCATGETRCDSSGRRLRCTSDGSWADDSYVCTVALSGSSDYNTMCALKADGRLGCWAAGDWANGQAAMMVARAPADTWNQISVADDAFDICAIGSAGTISCWNAMGGPTLRPPSAGTFMTVSYSIYGSCALTDTGGPVCFNGTLVPADFVGNFRQIVTANQLVYGIDDKGALHAPSFLSPGYPAASYKQIIANNGASCALRDDGAIFCEPVSGMLPPPTGNGFLEVAATYGNNNGCAIQADRTVTCWLGLSTMQPLEATPGGTFTHIAGCESAMCGIRTDGTTVCWGVPGFDPMVPPAGW